MAGFSKIDSTAGPTPNRVSHTRFDIVESILVVPPYNIMRQGREITADMGSSNVMQLQAGGWTVRPQTEIISSFQELSTSAIVQPTATSTDLQFPTTSTPSGGSAVISAIVRPMYRAPYDLLNATVNASNYLNASGDPFIFKSIPAGNSWQNSFSPDIASVGQPIDPSANIAVDRLAVGQVYYGENQGFVLRFYSTNVRGSHPDTILRFYFSNLFGVGPGGYCLSVLGDGRAILYMDTPNTLNPDPNISNLVPSNSAGLGYAWAYIDSFRYCQPGDVGASYHTIVIHPYGYLHTGAAGIEFRAGGNELGQVSSPATTTYLQGEDHIRSYTVTQQAIISALSSYSDGSVGWQQTVRWFSPGGGAGRAISQGGVIRIDMRRDLRVPIQIVKNTWKNPGVLEDQPIFIPFYPGSGQVLKVYWQSSVPGKIYNNPSFYPDSGTAGASITCQLYDAQTNRALPPAAVSGGLNWSGFRTGTTTRAIYPIFTLNPTTDGTGAPVLFSYKIVSDGAAGLTAGPEWESGVLRTWRAEGPDSTPDHEAADIEFQDPSNAMSKLANRGSIRMRLETEYDPVNPVRRVTIFDGYVQRAEAIKWGFPATTGFNGTRARGYPSPNAKKFEVNCIGMWQRLYEVICPDRIFLCDDVTYSPRKVTDVVRLLLEYAGFSSDQIDVPDLLMKFFPIPGGDISGIVVDLFSNIGEAVVKFCRDWLGCFLVWDGNAGRDNSTNANAANTNNSGMWRVLNYPRPPFNPIYSFYLDAPALSGYQIATGRYPPSSTFVQRGTFKTSVKAPEANVVQVVGVDPQAGKQYRACLVNTASYTFNSSRPADPTNPDYLGRVVPLTVIDPGLWGQAAVNWACARLYDLTAHAIKEASWTSPLQFVSDTLKVRDPNNSLFGKSISYQRPLRFGDVVSVLDQGVATTYLIRNCNPIMETKDHIQMAHYEAQIAPIGLY